MPHTLLLHPATNPLSSIKRKQAQIEKALAVEINDDTSFETWLANVQMTFPEYLQCLQTKINAPTLFIRRKPKDIWTNNFNQKLLHLWFANTDIQYVLNAHGAANYCTSYMTKVNTTLTQDLKQQFQSCLQTNASTIELLRRMGNTLLNTQ